MKTIEEIYMDVQERECPKVNNLTLPEDWQLKAMQEYANQQIELAVDKTLEIASEKAIVTNREIHHNDFIKVVDKQSILSLRTQILNEIKDR